MDLWCKENEGIVVESEKKDIIYSFSQQLPNTGQIEVHNKLDLSEKIQLIWDSINC